MDGVDLLRFLENEEVRGAREILKLYGKEMMGGKMVATELALMIGRIMFNFIDIFENITHRNKHQ